MFSRRTDAEAVAARFGDEASVMAAPSVGTRLGGLTSHVCAGQPEQADGIRNATTEEHRDLQRAWLL